LRGLVDIARAETEQTFSQLGFRRGGNFVPSGQTVPISANMGAVPKCQQRHHLLDLHDLFRGAAEKT